MPSLCAPLLIFLSGRLVVPRSRYLKGCALYLSATASPLITNESGKIVKVPLCFYVRGRAANKVRGGEDSEMNCHVSIKVPIAQGGKVLWEKDGQFSGQIVEPQTREFLKDCVLTWCKQNGVDPLTIAAEKSECNPSARHAFIIASWTVNNRMTDHAVAEMFW